MEIRKSDKGLRAGMNPEAQLQPALFILKRKWKSRT
jgi:hypothetical protein